jgi:hypothetical protein
MVTASSAWASLATIWISFMMYSEVLMIATESRLLRAPNRNKRNV